MCIEKNSKKLPTNYCLSLDSSRIGLKNSQFFKEEVGFFLKKVVMMCFKNAHTLFMKVLVSLRKLKSIWDGLHKKICVLWETW